jgi:hypothetical protein
LAFPAIVLGDVPKTSATSLGGILEILVYVLPSVRENTQKFANIISKNPISINKKNFLNMSKRILNKIILNSLVTNISKEAF